MVYSLMKKQHIVGLLAFCAVILTSLFQLGFFTSSHTCGHMIGFAKIMPYSYETQLFDSCPRRVDFPRNVYSNGEISMVFQNSLDMEIELIPENISIQFSYSFDQNESKKCTKTTADKAELSGGEKFELSASGCPKGMAGDVYDIEIIIPYSIEIGGIESIHRDSGFLRGPITDR